MSLTNSTPDTSKVERHGYLFGYPIAHSMSPLLHQTVYDELGLDWSQLPLESTDMNLFLDLIKHPSFYGASVTMPHKVAILKYLDSVTPEAEAVGAVNTLFIEENPNGKRLYHGTNTDVIGCRESFFLNCKPEVYENRPALIVGGGGAARSAVYALRTWMRVGTIYLVNRDADEVNAILDQCNVSGYGESLVHVSNASQAEQLEGVGAIIACVPNLTPVSPDEHMARKIMEVFLHKKGHRGAVLEMCYHPTPHTEIAEISRGAGWQVILGTEAMIYQGLEQDRYWTGKDTVQLPVRRVKEVIARKLEEA